MRVLVVAALAAAALVPVVPAHATVDPSGLLCEFPLPTFEGDLLTVSAGPLTLVDEAGPGPVSGRVTCTVQSGYQHADPDLGAATSDTMTGAVVLPPTQVGVAWMEVMHLCTQVDVDGGPTLYYDSWEGEWSTSALAPCEYYGPCPTSGSCGGGGDCSELLIDCLVCPVLLVAFPPDGDIVLPVVGPFWDCPPYGNVRPGRREPGRQP